MAQNQSAASPPVSYSSISQLNQLLSQLEQTSQQTQLDLAKLRVEKWKTDSNNKRQMQANVESVERNLQSALPEMIGQLRMSPENLTATFRVYRNLTALYDVFTAVAEKENGNRWLYQKGLVLKPPVKLPRFLYEVAYLQVRLQQQLVI